MPIRDGHLEETLRRILAETLMKEVQDPRVGFLTVSEVRLNRDHTVAQVFYTVMGDEAERARTLEGLKRCRGFLRQRIGEQIRLRILPELRFRYDDSLDRSFRLESVLDELRTDQKDSPAEDSGADPPTESEDEAG